MKRTNSRWLATGLAGLLSLPTSGLLLAMPPDNATPKHSVNEDRVQTPESLHIANALSAAFRDVSTKVLPSVVAIENLPASTGNSTRSSDPKLDGLRGNPFKGTPFEDMFPEGIPMNPQESSRERIGIGSGVIIDSTGIVLTNNHVVAGGGRVKIKTQDGREFIATEVFTDPQSDIAIVKFNGDKQLVAAQLGNSDNMEVGDWVVALGQPFGLESTVTAGIVSAKDRGVGITERESFIQTDAAINPGNSGGPLVNLNGEVIGINTAISSRNGGNMGVGFAVPINLARWVGDQLLVKGHVDRSYLGVSIQPVSFELSSQLGVSPNGGVAITNVFPNTPAAKSGLKTGDVIVKLDGMPISTPHQLQLAVERMQTDKPVTLGIVRDGKPMDLSFEPEMAPNDFAAKAGSMSESMAEKSNLLGLEVSELTKDVAKQLGLDSSGGVLVTNVESDSKAATAGIEAGSVIVQVNRQDVNNVKEFEKAVEADKDGSVLLLVRTEQGSRFVVVEGN